MNIFKRICIPFKIILMHRAAFFVWFLFTLLGGLVGVIISIMRHLWFSDIPYTFKQALYIETTNGAFYTYSIATVAAVLGALFVLFAERQKLSYRTLQIPIAALTVFILLFGGVFYALNIDSGALVTVPEDSDLEIDWIQLTVLFLAFLFSVYSFCLSRIDEHDKVFENIKDENFYKNSSNTTIDLPNSSSNIIVSHGSEDNV